MPRTTAIMSASSDDPRRTTTFDPLGGQAFGIQNVPFAVSGTGFCRSDRDDTAENANAGVLIPQDISPASPDPPFPSGRERTRWSLGYAHLGGHIPTIEHN